MTRRLMPGIVFALAVAIAGSFLADHLSVLVARLSGIDPSDKNAHHLVSGISLSVIGGLFVRNVFGVADAMRPGISWILKTGLRIGIVLLGFKLALGTTGDISGKALPVVVACIATALVVVTFFNNRLRLPPRLGALVAVGTSICGVTAIVATGPAIDADENETSYAVACITIFGLLALFTYPWLAWRFFHSDPLLAGIFLGTSIHDTSQVAGAGMIYQEAFNEPLALQAATVTKLIRNMSMAILIPLVAARFGRPEESRVGSFSLKRVKDAIPGFVLAFLVAIAIRSLGDALFSAGAPAAWWNGWLEAANWISKWALAGALAGIGLNTDILKLKGLGVKPLLVGLVAASVVGLVSFASLTLMYAR
ncbi:putative sulfate exporter family transporter [bacterium]|nr:putative sulfate exporter family transporter [bacterium]